MADISDVAKAVRDVAAAALAEAGMLQPGAGWAGTRVFWGWPGPEIDADLAKGVVNVSVYPRSTVRNLGPYLDGWQDDLVPVASMTVEVGDDGDTVTFAGTASLAGMIAAVSVGDALTATHVIQSSDTPASVATALAALLEPDWPGAEATGAVLTIPGAYGLQARVVASGTESKEVRRVVQGLVITVWAPTAASRDAVAKVVDNAFMEARRLPLPDGTTGFITYDGTGFDEEARKAPLMRRDINVSVEYPSIQTRAAPAVAAIDIDAEPDNAPVTHIIVNGGPE